MTVEDKFVQLFEDVSKGVSKYITLDVLQIGIPYEVVNFRLYDSTYGRCLIVDLADGCWLILPKRIGDTMKTEEQTKILNSKKYWMVFKGRHEQYRKMAVIEFKTMEQFLQEQAPVDPGMPVLDFTYIANDLMQDAATQTEATQVANTGTQTEPIKTGVAPKVTIKVKKDRK